MILEKLCVVQIHVAVQSYQHTTYGTHVPLTINQCIVAQDILCTSLQLVRAGTLGS